MAADVDTLYALRPEEFTAARDRLAASLRAAGDRGAAAEVKMLRRPTVAAWVLNRLVREQPDRVRELAEAGEAIRAAQRRAASGTKDSGFREATARRREVVLSLTRAAAEILAHSGRGGSGTEDEIARTLEIASVDRAAADELLQGRLARPILGGGGFEAVTGFEVVPDALPSEAERHADEVALRNAERRADQAEAEARRAAMRAEHLEEQARAAAEKAKEARADVERLERAAADARGRLHSRRKS